MRVAKEDPNYTWLILLKKKKKKLHMAYADETCSGKPNGWCKTHVSL